MRRYALTVIAAVVSACVTTPGQIHGLADADDPSARADAVKTAVRWLKDRKAPVALRISAARSLGRLREVDAGAIANLATVVGDHRASRDLRCMAAWALGELRSPESLQVLASSLRGGLASPIDEYVLEGLTKHLALMKNDDQTLLSVVEGLVFYAGNRRTGLPQVYQLLTDRTRTVGVNVEVLARTVQQTRRNRTDRQRAALYNAAFELLARLEDRRDAIAAGPQVWGPRISAAVQVAGDAYALEDLRTQVLVLYFLGRLATMPEVAGRAASTAVDLRLGRAAQSHVSLQLLATWVLDRLQLSSVTPRQVLVKEVLMRTHDPVLLRLISDLGQSSSGMRQYDAAQRWLELEGAGR